MLLNYGITVFDRGALDQPRASGNALLNKPGKPSFGAFARRFPTGAADELPSGITALSSAAAPVSTAYLHSQHAICECVMYL